MTKLDALTHVVEVIEECYGNLTDGMRQRYVDAFAQYTPDELRSAMDRCLSQHKRMSRPSIDEIRAYVQPIGKRVGPSKQFAWEAREYKINSMCLAYLKSYKANCPLYKQAVRERWDWCLLRVVLDAAHVQAEVICGANGIGGPTNEPFPYSIKESGEYFDCLMHDAKGKEYPQVRFTQEQEQYMSGCKNVSLVPENEGSGSFKMVLDKLATKRPGS